VTSARPQPLPVVVENIPGALKEIPHWLVWKYIDEIDPETGAVDWDKPPMSAKGGPGSSTNRKTWTDFATALRYYRDRHMDGLGFVLHHNGEDRRIVAIDLDKCRDQETGVIEKWALKIIRALNSYTEVSPSGTGIRIFVCGALPPHGMLNGRKKGPVEAYEKGRYVTVTGQHIDGTPAAIEDRQDELMEFYKKNFGGKKTERHKANGSAAALGLDNRELLERAFRSKNGGRIKALFDGDTSGYPSQSEAELAFCNHLAFWFNRDADRMFQVICESGLYRTKWKRDDYRDGTICKAIEGCREVYDPQRRGPKAKPGTNGNGHHEPEVEPAPEIHLTDLGNARRVVERHGRDWRHCHPWKKSLVFDGRRWAEDDTAAVVRFVKETQASLYQWAAGKIAELGDVGDDERRKAQLAKLTAVLNHCLKWEDARAVKRCIELAVSEPGIPVLPADLDRDPWLLNVQNGTLDLRTGQLRQHRREDLMTKLAPVAYDPKALCPLWMNCVTKWMGGNQRLLTYLQRAAGYSLTADVGEQILFFLYGSGANGKSTFLLTLLDLLGDYAIQTVSDLLMVKNTESHPTERADLFGRRFAATIETEEGKRMAEALTKQLTGGDKVKARKMRQDFFEFSPTWKIWLAANHYPQIRGTDYAIWRRVKLIPFTVTIPDAEKDKQLAQKLRAEAPGILAWCVRGCLAWQKDGMEEPDEVRAATEAYRKEQDTIQEFLHDCCVLNEQFSAQAGKLLEAYVSWSGEKISAKAFRQKLNDKGYHSERGVTGHYRYKGIGLPAAEGSEGCER
jgi:putative DNA primase/helicase